MIHPCAAAEEVDSFLVTMGWTNIADDLFSVERTMLGMTDYFLEPSSNLYQIKHLSTIYRASFPFEFSSRTTLISMLSPAATFSNCCDILLPMSLNAKN